MQARSGPVVARLARTAHREPGTGHSRSCATPATGPAPTPASGLLERIFLALELLWFLLAALLLTPGQPPAPAHPPPPGQPFRPKPLTGTRIPPGTGHQRPERVCCVSPGENLCG